MVVDLDKVALKFICAAPTVLRGMLSSIPDRLYAYPSCPEPAAGVTILDSGAFALAKRRRSIGERHMRDLAEYYRAYAGERTLCIAPDVYLRPGETMRNWRWWHAHIKLPVVPVIQFPKRFSYLSAVQQALFYAPYRSSVLAISNPGLEAIEAGELMRRLAQRVREVVGARALHLLGAGWSPQDIIAWRNMGCFESIDSIAWYTDARDGWVWQIGGRRERVTHGDWREIALENARVACLLAADTGEREVCV